MRAYFSHEAIASVLRRLGIDPATSFDKLDQDAEYTACRAEELPVYFQCYSAEDISPHERAVLCCFMLEGLNEYIQTGKPHAMQSRILDSLMATDEHAEEIAYWSDTSDPDPKNWRPLAATLLLRHQNRESRRSD